VTTRATRKAHYDREVRSVWEEAESKRDVISEQQKARRKALARENQELIDKLRAKFASEDLD